jgi:phage terminase large subunit-like protein
VYRNQTENGNPELINLAMIQLLDDYKPLFYEQPDTRYYLITGGRGSGKSWTLALFLLNLTYEKGHVILFTRYTLVSAFISIIPEFLDKIEIMGKMNDFDVTQSEIINKLTGSKILFRGIKTSSGVNTANLKSIAGLSTWVVDEAEELTDPEIFDKVDLSIRAKDVYNRVILVMNPSYKSHWIYQDFVKNKRKDTTYIHTTYLDNKINLSESFVQAAEKTKRENRARYDHLFMGTWLDDAEGMLWNRAIIGKARVDEAPNLKRIVVALDPAVTANMNSDETGIIVVGKCKEGFGYVLEDLSGKYSPNHWAKIANDAAFRWNADCIVAEKNQGGDMVEAVLKAQGTTTRIKLVSATKGKYVRAEPVYSLYEKGQVYHVGSFPLLESQMVTFDPDKGKSPDRVDALVWGLTELMVKNRSNGFVLIKGKLFR